MAIVMPPGWGQVRFQFSQTGQSGDVMIVSGYAQSNSTTAQEDAENFAETWVEQMLLVQNSNVALLGVTTIYNDGGVLTEGLAIVGEPGELTGDCLPPNCAYLARKFTGFAGRGARGRMYIPGVDTDTVGNSGLLGAQALIDLQAACDLFISELEVNHLQLVILHDDGGATADDDPVYVTALQAQPKIATQRGRLRD